MLKTTIYVSTYLRTVPGNNSTPEEKGIAKSLLRLASQLILLLIPIRFVRWHSFAPLTLISFTSIYLWYGIITCYLSEEGPTPFP